MATARIDWAFFGLAPRLWELAAGGLIGIFSLVLPTLTGPAMRIVGLTLIVWPAMTYIASDPLFPGLSALPPVLGAILVVAAPAAQRDPTFWLLTNQVTRWIGTRSYGLYLWHWPLIVATRLWVEDPSEGDFILALMIAFPTAEISFRLIERPVRQGLAWRQATRMAALCLLPLALTSEDILVIGDSHGHDLFHAMRAGFPDQGFVLLHQSGCAPAEYVMRDGSLCFPSLPDILSLVTNKILPAGVILTARWGPGTYDTLSETLTALNGTPVVVVGPGPSFANPITAMSRGQAIDAAELSDDLRLSAEGLRHAPIQTDQDLRKVAGTAPYVDRMALICPDSECLAVVPATGRLMFWDNQHLTPTAQRWLVGLLAQDAGLCGWGPLNCPSLP